MLVQILNVMCLDLNFEQVFTGCNFGLLFSRLGGRFLTKTHGRDVARRSVTFDGVVNRLVFLDNYFAFLVKDHDWALLLALLDRVS